MANCGQHSAGLDCLITRAIGIGATEWTISVRLASTVSTEPFSGRVYVFFSKRENVEPRLVFRFVHSEPIIAKDVVDWKPGEILTFSRSELGDILKFPSDLANMELAGYRAQAVVRLNMLEPEIGAGEGNAYSSVITLPDFREQNASILLDVDKRAPRIDVRTSKEREVLEVRSKLLSTFHKRPVTINAAVVLPPSYFEQPQQRYPVLFDIPSFGGTHHFPRTHGTDQRSRDRVYSRGARWFLSLGHHAFADSANNGPCGSAFVQIYSCSRCPFPHDRVTNCSFSHRHLLGWLEKPLAPGESSGCL